jgi:hypothetical protein
VLVASEQSGADQTEPVSPERNHPMTFTRYSRSAIAAMYAGLALTIGAMLVLYVGHSFADVLANHIKAGYPSYSQARIDTAAMTYLVYLSVLGVAGILGWATTIWAAGTRKPWARWVATGLFATGTTIALFNLLVTDTSGDTGLPPLLGWVGILPCLAGLLAVIASWKKQPRQTKV